MRYTIRPVNKDDEAFLWKMLYYAAHMEEEGETSIHAAKHNPGLVKYVQEWGRESDQGYLALDSSNLRPIGAAWIRLFVGQEKMVNSLDDGIPELAIAVLPEYVGKGVGTQLLTHLVAAAKERYSSIVLSVRVTNPARRLYERQGFVVIGTTSNRVGTESVIMRKDL
ncbi:MAG TPA: GNAT family N-acetyltransferase [Ktedonobacteraceae bacterium]|nr:GNAT family N-acetyltransferase [Ktedonobacteraceae bacterium]